MRLVAGGTSPIRSRFRGRDELLDRGLRDHPSFRDLCGDYEACAVALERWRRNEGAAGARVREYEELLAELGREVEEWFEALSKACPAGRGEPMRTDGGEGR